jgi:hypothetical protein
LDCGGLPPLFFEGACSRDLVLRSEEREQALAIQSGSKPPHIPNGQAMRCS